ncbi:MAG TPA: DUF2339 domain-containing protein [Gemmatimonadaceae bacterium]|nr:DUF2339 domain-containing protein [Gemmatimonadaceae bacterium]
MPSPERDTEDLQRRLESLEASVRALSNEVHRLRADRAAPPIPAPRPTQPAAAHSHAVPSADRSDSWVPAQIDFESLIGRYGTLILSTVSALAAVGLFLNWAIEKGFLGPQQRLGLGLIAAVGLAVAGLRLRRTERSFGASLLGLSLAVTLVCAWGAGPALGLVPDWAAFALAAVTSVALAVFAHAEEDEPLWSVGFVGAAIAPFITANGRSNLILLAAYGVAVLGSAGYAMNARRWLVAGRLFLLVALLYTATLATAREAEGGPLLAMGFPLAAALVGVLPWSRGWARRERLRALGVLSAMGAVRSGFGTQHPLDALPVALMIAGAGVLWMVLADRTHLVRDALPAGHRRSHEGDWLDAGVLPLGFALAALAALDASANSSGWFMAAAGVVLLVSVMRAPLGNFRDAAAFATFICALLAELLLLQGRGSAFVASLAVLAASAFAANRLWRSGSWTTLGLIGLAGAFLMSFVQLSERPAYAYTPFLTESSAVALVVLAALVASMSLAAGDRRLVSVLRGGCLAWAFLWVHQEIAFAMNPTASTLFRVTYYAATAVGAVWIGRARGVPVLRHVGLGLAIVAAGAALYGARDLQAIGARIGAALVAAAFLMAIAYWYRRRGTRTAVGSQMSA